MTAQPHVILAILGLCNRVSRVSQRGTSTRPQTCLLFICPHIVHLTDFRAAPLSSALAAATAAARITKMSVKGKVNVFSRVRPGLAREDGDQHCITNHLELKKCVVSLEDGDAVERVLAGGSAAPGKVQEKSFTFDGVFDPDCSQKEVYEEVGKPVLKDVLQGYNGSILAYGQTSAGKTHSLLNSGMGMNGKPDPKQAGLLPRLVAALFVHIGADTKHAYTVEASMLQIYNEHIDCLLCEDREKGQGLQVTGKSDVKGLTWISCKTPSDMLMCFQRGRNNLVYAETKMNKSSSRSHAVFQIKISKRSRATSSAKAGGGGKVEMKATFGKLTVVDLAGSERIKKSGASGAQFKEATNINGSLLAFGNVVQALAEKKKFIPYRDSKLTRILEDSVGGNCKTSLLVCCSPSMESADETVCTLEFASRAARIEIVATINETTVMVDAKSLIADVAGEGLDTALKEKQREMTDLENKLKADGAKNEAELKKAKDEAIKKQMAETAKAVEAGKLEETYKAKADEAAKKIKELEAAVKQAAEAKEVKAEMKKMVDEKEREVEVLKKTLAEERKARAQGDDERAKMLVRQVSKTKALLDEANAHTSKLEVRAGEAEALGAALGEKLQDSAAALESATKEASEAAVKAAEEHAAAISQMAQEQAAALVEKEFQTMARIDEAVGAAKSEVEADSEKQEAVLVRQWSLKLSTQAQESAAEIAGVNAELAETKAKFEEERMIQEEVVETLKTEAKKASFRIYTLQKEAENLAADIEAARAEVIEQREAAAEENARLNAAHAEVLAKLNEKRLEDAAVAGKRLAESEEAHAADVDSIRTRAESREKRLSWAFSASKALLAETNAAIKADHDRMKKRFDARDSRDDDVLKISELSAVVSALDNMNKHLKRETQDLSRELENRDQNDTIFGGVGGMRGTPGSAPRKSPTGGRVTPGSTSRSTASSGGSSFLSATGTSLGGTLPRRK